jgi:uncharacterized membrane protein SpoIIM required for sporulation
MSENSVRDFRFVREREEGWKRLSDLLDRAQGAGINRLSGEDALELGRLYRRAASDLAYVRTHLPDPGVLRRLNDLVGRAHGFVYVSEKGGGAGLIDFYWREFPLLLRKYRAFVLVAWGIFLAGALFALSRPDLQPFIVPKEYSTPHIGGASSPYASGYITQNNIRVALMAFALGIPLGVATLLLLFSNGMMLGGAGILIAQKGQSAGFWPCIAPHGVLELSAIMIAGAAGMILGWTLLHPGDLPRGKALALAAADAVRLLAGTIPMFVVAGTIEGFVSFSSLSPYLKLLVSALSAAAMALYFTPKRRDKREKPPKMGAAAPT